MRALAEFAADEHCRLSGSDTAPSARSVAALSRVGLDVRRGHAAEHLPDEVDGVIFSPAVDPDNAERRAAATRGVPQASYPQILGRLSREFPTIAVAGTHGKSTTTALIATALAASQRDRAVLCGAEVLGRGRHGWSGPGEWCVAEACEYRRHFLELSPKIGLILGIEPDHFDCFPDLRSAQSAYAEFATNVATDGRLLARSDCPATREMLTRIGNRHVETIALNEAADWTAVGVDASEGRLRCEILRKGRREATANVPLLGRHHAINVLAAYAAGREAGNRPDDLADAFGDFPGLHRRLERLPDAGGLIRFDDYAHHPTAVRAVLQSLRESFPGRRLWCVFQPHQLSRTERLSGEFAAALGEADETIVVPVYAARETDSGELSRASQRLAEAVPRPCRSRFSATLDHVVTTVQTAVRPGELLLTLGAGDIDRLHHEFARRLS